MINPDNFEFTQICDLGGAIIHGVTSRWQFILTPGYAAPEVLKLIHSEFIPFDNFQADLFSYGVVAFVVLTGKFPFETTIDLIDPNHLNAKLIINPEERFCKLSSLAQEFVGNFFCLEPRERPSAEDALHDLWFNDKMMHDRECTLRSQTKFMQPRKTFPKVTRRSLRIAARRTKRRSRSMFYRRRSCHTKKSE